MKKILVTGGAGFIGSYLCEKLLIPGNMVIALDNLVTGSFENLKKLIGNGKFAFVKADVCSQEIGQYAVDEIYHLACPASPVHYQVNQLHTIESAFIGTRNMLQQAKECGARILLASTSEVYGEAQRHPQDEGYYGNVCTTGPRACYDEGKRAAETLGYIFSNEFNVTVRTARIFNTYGPGMALEDGRVVTEFVRRALTGKDIVISGDGAQTRSFCYIDDTVNGLMALMKSGISGPVNIGNPEEISIGELAKTIKRMCGSESMLVKSVHHAPNDPLQRKPDITVAARVLKWVPQVSLVKGLELTIADMRRRIIQGW